MKRKQKAQRKLWIVLMAVVLAIAVSFGIFLVAQRVSYPLKYQDQIEQMARKYDLEPSLIFGVIHTESRMNPQAVSPVGAVGLMQIMPDTGQWIAQKLNWEDFEEEQLKMPEKNLELGCWYLRYLLDRFDADINAVLAGYNAGPNRVAQWLQNEAYTTNGKLTTIPNKDAEQYVERVLHAKEKYQSLYKVDY